MLDEPAAALDYGNAMRVIGKIRELAAGGLATIMTTRSPDHAFMCRSNAALLGKADPAVAGVAEDVITERNLYEAYGVGVKTVEFSNASGTKMHLCAPVV